ncbi:MAG: PilZ domain-containing protein [Bdellovibrionales bacterium]|nr:PilZ domain-containing protein [Bdellovibrionales bacterium]
MKNVIDLTRRLKKESKSKAAKGKGTTAAAVIDMTEKRAEIIEQERRQTKRTILSEFIGAFALVPRKGLLKVNLYDISENGMGFDVSEAAGHFSVGEEVAMRVYLNHETYFSFVVKIQNIRGIDDEMTYRHGGAFVKGSINDEALHHFVRFVETVSAILQIDHGDLQVSSVVR